jgi:hypothetical protein
LEPFRKDYGLYLPIAGQLALSLIRRLPDWPAMLSPRFAPPVPEDSAMGKRSEPIRREAGRKTTRFDQDEAIADLSNQCL